ncbi:MAG: sulfurtransferase TusA family protein [Caulobacteraceae bacterium]|nr:sulfurtransferase TusA family protein [Caulobacteraceae bacterium]
MSGGEIHPLTIDTRGHRCPVPSLRLRRALEQAEAGARLRLLADDPLARIDIPHLLREMNLTLVGIESAGTELIFTVEKTSPAPGS